jgi:hypothetical protein
MRKNLQYENGNVLCIEIIFIEMFLFSPEYSRATLKNIFERLKTKFVSAYSDTPPLGKHPDSACVQRQIHILFDFGTI